ANIPDEQLDPLLGIVCPTMLYPYLRANVADAITRTSLPALHLAEVNFQSLYEQRIAELAQQQQRQQSQGSDSGIYVPPGTKTNCRHGRGLTDWRYCTGRRKLGHGARRAGL